MIQDFCKFFSVIIDFSGLLLSCFVFLISLLALILSIYHGCKTQKNYRLSATPFIAIGSKWIPGGEFIGIYFENKGIGPAIITNIDICVENQFNFDAKSMSSFVIKLVSIMNTDGLNELKVFPLDKGEMLAVNEKRLFICLPDNDINNSLFINSFQNSLTNVKISIDYKSIYNDEFTTEQSKWEIT